MRQTVQFHHRGVLVRTALEEDPQSEGFDETARVGFDAVGGAVVWEGEDAPGVEVLDEVVEVAGGGGGEGEGDGWLVGEEAVEVGGFGEEDGGGEGEVGGAFGVDCYGDGFRGGRHFGSCAGVGGEVGDGRVGMKMLDIA